MRNKMVESCWKRSKKTTIFAEKNMETDTIRNKSNVCVEISL